MSEPTDPGEGYSVVWRSSGGGFGDDGDLCVKTQSGGTITSNRLHTFVHPHGQLFLDATQEHNLTAAYAYMTNMVSTNTSSALVASESNLVILVDGLYLCNFQISFGGAVGEEYEAAVHVGGVEQNNVECQRKPGTADIGSMSSCGLLQLDIGDVVDLRVRSLDPAANFDPNKIQLVLTWISD